VQGTGKPFWPGRHGRAASPVSVPTTLHGCRSHQGENLMIGKGKIELDAKDWLTDLALGKCSLEEQGALVRLMAMASLGKPYGFLVDGEGHMTDDQIAFGLHRTPKQWDSLRGRLLNAKRIAQDDKTKAIYVPRMVKDAAIREQATEGGASGGNPDLIKGKPDKMMTRITISSFWNKMPQHLSVPEVREALEGWYELRRRTRFPFTSAAVSRAVNTLAPLSAEEATRWLWCAHDRGWRGLYPPPDDFAVEGPQGKLETDTAVLDYAKQYRTSMDKRGTIPVDEVDRFRLKVEDNLGRGGWIRVLKAVKQLREQSK
jgi:hypothetical protein